MDNYKAHIPDEIIRNPHYIFKILNWNTWSKYIHEKEKETLMALLPVFPTNNQIERQKTLKMLFEGQVFDSQNPGQHFVKLLKNGAFDPKISQYIKAKITYRYKEFHRQLHHYHCNLLREIILMREQTLQQAHRLSCYTPLPKTDALPKLDYHPQLCPLLSQVLKQHKKRKCSLPFTNDTTLTIKNSWQIRWEEFKTRTGEFMSSSNESTDESITEPSPNDYRRSVKAKSRLHEKAQLTETCYSLENGSTDEEDQPCTVLIGARESPSAPSNQTLAVPGPDLKKEERLEYERFLRGPYLRLLKNKLYQ